MYSWLALCAACSDVGWRVLQRRREPTSWLVYPASRLQRLLQSAASPPPALRRPSVITGHPSRLKRLPHPLHGARMHSVMEALLGECCVVVCPVKWLPGRTLDAGAAARGGGAEPPLAGRLAPPPRKKPSEKSGARTAVSHGRARWADARNEETARPRTGGRGRAMPALALRDQPLDCSMRLRELPAWPPPHPRALPSDQQRHGNVPPTCPVSANCISHELSHEAGVSSRAAECRQSQVAYCDLAGSGKGCPAGPSPALPPQILLTLLCEPFVTSPRPAGPCSTCGGQGANHWQPSSTHYRTQVRASTHNPNVP
ncbi:unnamed protein product [Spodoptera exigua]|nr:unnamed protein product [Spodoptera exigua]